MHVFYKFRLFPFYHSPTPNDHDSTEQKIFGEILNFAKQHHIFFFLQGAPIDVIKSMHGSQPCLNPPSMAQHTVLHKEQPYLHPRLVQDCSGFLTMVRKKEMLLHHSPLPIATGRKHRAEAALLLFFFFLPSVLYATQRKSPLKEEDHLHVAEPKKSKSRHEEGCPVRCGAAFLRNTIISLHSSSRN